MASLLCQARETIGVLSRWLQNCVHANSVVMENCCGGIGVWVVVSPSHLNRLTAEPPAGSGEVLALANKSRGLICELGM